MAKHKYEMQHIIAIMICIFRTGKAIVVFIFVGVLSVILLSGCSMIWINQVSHDRLSSECKCMDVDGIVLGNLKTNVSITLYRAEKLDHESIVEKLGKGQPERITSVAANQSFSFYCLPEDYYLLSIPTSSYNYAVGSPIVSKRIQGNLKAETILQGGNSQDLFSVLSVSQVS